MELKNYKVTGIGAALVDTELTVTPDFLNQCGIEKGVMTLVDEARQDELMDQLTGTIETAKRASGGSACNTLFALAQFGSQSSYACLIAEDENGAHFAQDAEAAGLRLISKPAASGKTGKCLVFVTPDADRTMNTYLGVSEKIGPEQLSESEIAGAHLLYVEGYLVTSPTGKQAAIDAMNMARQSGTQTAISLSDPAMVQFFKDGLKEMIGQGVSLLFCNADEALAWTEAQTTHEAIEQLSHIADTVVITLGAKGALVFDQGQIMAVEGESVKAIDTNGAGDLFAGAFIHAVGQGLRAIDAAGFANFAASKVVQQYGPRLDANGYQAILESLNQA